MINQNLAVFFPKDSEAMFNKNSVRTFGGSTIHLYQFVRELYNSVEIYTLLPEYDNIEFDDIDKFNIIKLYRETDNGLMKLIKFRNFIKQYNINVVVQLGLTIESCIMALFCYLHGIKFVFMFAHDIESMGYYQNSRKKCLLFPILTGFSELLIAQNDTERDNLLRRYPQLTKIRVLKKGIDFSRIYLKSAKKYDAIWIARCEEWKNAEAYLKIVELNPDRRFLLITPPVPGKEYYYNTIKTKAECFKNLTFFSFVPYTDVYKYMAQSKIIFVTSDMEGDWPLTVIEAAASGLPVISLNYSYGTLVKEYNAGFFCEGRIDTMNTIFNSIIKSPSLLKKYTKNAVNYARENHDSKKNAALLLKWLEI